jgi:hypothetical protein
MGTLDGAVLIRDASVVAGRGVIPLFCDLADPGCQFPAAKDAETGTGGEIGAQYRRAQLLAAVRRVRNGQPGSSCFFARQRPLQAAPVHLDAEARLEGSRHFGVVNWGLRL